MSPAMQHLQRRIIRLLLQHDVPLLRGQFRLFFTQSQLPGSPLLQQYDRYIRLQMFSSELLDHILPRIRRQLSLKTDHVRQREEALPRGTIDWPRTIERSWNTAPGSPPLQFETRQRQRSMHTPENLLTVAILLTFRRELQQAIGEIFADEELNSQEKQALAAFKDACERELSAAYAHALLDEAAHVDIATLAQTVLQHLRPGPSPYRDLLRWWHDFSAFRVGRATAARATALASVRNDEKADAWLYELWIALEGLHLFQEEGCVQPQHLRVATDLLQCEFTWRGRQFRFTYNRQPEMIAGNEPAWEHAPPSRPDYMIERVEPLRISHEGKLIWQEPPILLDAKYYLEGNDPANTHGPIKKLLGDMTLLGAQTGILFFPLIAEPADEQQITRTIHHSGVAYHPGQKQHSQYIHLYRLEPGMPFAILQQRLCAILDLATEKLPERPAPACHGVWLDVDSQNATQHSLPSGTILCPKPHISDHVVDLVHVERDCLKNPYLCHIIGKPGEQPIMPPFVMRAANEQQVEQRSQEIRARNEERLRAAEQAGDEERAEQLRRQIMTSIGHTTEQFVDMFGETNQIDSIERLFDLFFRDYWMQHKRSLAEATRHALISGEYVWLHYQKVQLQDWAAPAIQYCRALEHELKRRLYNPCPGSYPPNKAGFTIGTVEYAYQEQQYKARPLLWQIFLDRVKRSGGKRDEFESLLRRLSAAKVKDQRNMLAHGGKVSRESAQMLREIIVGERNRPGVLIWLAENLDPA